MALVAIEFEEDQLLVAIAQKSGQRFRISDVFVLDVTGDEDTAAGAALKNKLSELGESKSDAIAIVSRSLAEIRELTVPPAPDNELPDMIRFQARNEFASLNDQWKLDYVTLTHDPESPRKVLAAAVSPQLETRIQTVCQNAGLKLKRIALRPFATLDLMKPVITKKKLGDGNLALIVDQNIDSTDLSVIQNGKMLSTRTVRIPLTQSSDQRAKLMITEVRRTLASHKMTSGGDGAIQHVFVSGEEARHRHLKGNLENKLEMTVSFIDPFSLVEFVKRPKANGDNDLARFASLLGALKTEASGDAPVLDFANVRKTEVQKTDFSKLYFYGALAAGIALVGLLFAWYILASQAKEIEAERANLVQAIKINSGDERFPSVDQKLNEVRLIDQWKIEDVNWLTELSDFSSRFLLPDDVIADSYTASVQRDGTPKIVLRGKIVEDLTKTDQLIRALSERPYEVEPIDTGTVAPDQASDYPSTFEYHLNLPESAKEDLNGLNRRAVEFGRGVTPEEGSQQ